MPIVSKRAGNVVSNGSRDRAIDRPYTYILTLPGIHARGFFFHPGGLLVPEARMPVEAPCPEAFYRASPPVSVCPTVQPRLDERALCRMFRAALWSRSRTSRRVVTVRLNILLRQVSLKPPPNRTYTFPRIRLSEFSSAFSFSRLTFLHGVHHGIPHKAPSSCVFAQSSGVPKAFCLSDFLAYGHDVLPPACFGCRPIRIHGLIGVFLTHSGFGTPMFWAAGLLAHTSPFPF